MKNETIVNNVILINTSYYLKNLFYFLMSVSKHLTTLVLNKRRNEIKIR